MEAVLVQLYRIASSPKAFPGPILPRTLCSLITSNSPSAATYKWAPAKQIVDLILQQHSVIYLFIATLITYWGLIWLNVQSLAKCTTETFLVNIFGSTGISARKTTIIFSFSVLGYVLFELTRWNVLPRS